MVLRIDFKEHEQRQLLYSILDRLGSQYTITITKGKARVGLFAYYRGVVLKLISEHVGEDQRIIHEALLEMFSTRLEIIDGQEQWVKHRTSHMNTLEFLAYIERCRMWAAEFLNIVIPDPKVVHTL